MLLKGDCLELLADLPDNSVDSIVTDPPYELGFMGKSWDNSGIAYSPELWKQALRVLKPGGHLLSFGGSRTYHRMACAIEDAGFEIRDQIMWIYGSGFPKSLDVSKAIDKSAGAERKVVGYSKGVTVEDNQGYGGIARGGVGVVQKSADIPVTAPSTSEAQRWQGWGTALKPAHEPVVVARKPLEGTVASNVLNYGTGALNIDGSRVGTEERTYDLTMTSGNFETTGGNKNEKSGTTTVTGRWPANVIHDGSDEVLEGFPDAKGGTWNRTEGARHFNNNGETTNYETSRSDNTLGSAARFFYCAKASKSERNAGLEGLPEKREADRIKDDGVGGDNPRNRSNNARQNFHPTVKPISLMRYLVRMVTPPNGVVLDPFLGSGTTGMAAILEGFQWIGCEMTPDYWPIIESRIAWAEKEYAEAADKAAEAPATLF